ncbi:MAG: hypothetical protein V7L14_23945 [Nostoc sp.]|uniref:hypothetical protein n=1 Tax=unclassified Nostoc TaxID=2593658 RepID=UPI0025FF2E67|nr:hypothetical protein [Nostoc sp. NOS(2021)]MBN3897631.1 hypothetical protein [Nostoc sp. NOS(2021)]
MQNLPKARSHSLLHNSDRFIFEVFCKAIALTLGQQAIALFLRFSSRRYLR